MTALDLLESVVSTRRGGPEALDLVRGPLPLPGPGEALVRVRAAGVSAGDLLLARGVIPGAPKPPYTPGFDLTGTVEALGDGVAGPAVGSMVGALVRKGAYATHAVVDADRLVPVPLGVDPVDASAVALNYFIARQMLHRVAKVRAGSRVLVHGASGGVGVAFCQLARLADVEVWGTSSPANFPLLADLGAHPIDYRTQDATAVVAASAGGRVDAAFDPIGGSHFRRSYAALRRGGIMVGYGQSAVVSGGQVHMSVGAKGFLLGIVAPKLLPDGRRTTFYNAWALERSQPEAYRDDLGAIFRLLADGAIAPAHVDTVDLPSVATAWQRLDGTSGDPVTGKLVITPTT